MNENILGFLRRPYALLVWALVCGAAYLSLAARFVLSFTNTAVRGGIILWIFCPAIVCGAALLIVKGVKSADERGNTRAMLALFWFHMFVILMGALFFASMLV